METLFALFSGMGTGILGSLVSRGMGIFESWEKRKQLKMEMDHEIKLHGLQAQERVHEREHEANIAYDDNATTALVGSYTHDSTAKGLLRWVRPALTLLLILQVTAMFFSIDDPDFKSKIAERIVYLTSTAVSWWFADRSGKTKNDR